MYRPNIAAVEYQYGKPMARSTSLVDRACIYGAPVSYRRAVYRAAAMEQHPDASSTDAPVTTGDATLVPDNALHPDLMPEPSTFAPYLHACINK